MIKPLQTSIGEGLSGGVAGVRARNGFMGKAKREHVLTEVGTHNPMETILKRVLVSQPEVVCHSSAALHIEG